MGISRREKREIIMRILYQIDIYEERGILKSVDELILANTNKNDEFIENTVKGVIENKEELDKIANNYIENWTIDRLDKTGAAILRMALYEIRYTSTPFAVVIDEAMEMAKKYSDDAVRKIINAVLDKYSKA